MRYFYSFLLGCIAFSYSNGQSCTELFFSEYIEGSSNNKAIEVYNPSTNTVNLSNYEIHRFNNGSTSSSGTFTLSGTLDSGEVYVISNPSANASILGKSDTTSTITYYNGDDVLLLIKGTDTLDAIGELGVDPGTNWTVGTGATSEYTLVRKSNVDQGTTDWTTGATQWDVYPQDTDTDLGMHTSNCIASPPSTGLPLYTISQITTNDANGVADSLNVECAIEGVVYTIDFDGNNGISFYIEDATDGINVFNFNDVDSYVVTAGDKLYIEGSVGQYNGLTEMVPDSIYVVSSSNPLPTPSVVTSITESNEGRYIQLNNVSLVDTSQWPSLNQWANVDVTNGTDTLAIYIDSDSDIDGSPVPTGMFNIKGAGSQFDFSSPYTSGYQLIPSSVNDIMTAPASTNPCGDLFFSEYIEGGSNNKALEIYNPTSSSISLAGYSVAMFSNGATSATATFSLYGSLASGDVFILCADAANATILGKADTALSYPSPAHFNGNDAVILMNSSNDTIDAIGIVGNDPGSSGWAVGSGYTKDFTLVRMASVDEGTKDWTLGANQWDVHPKDTTMYLGAHTSNCLGSMPTACNELFFSEYIEGGSNNKAIEIFNPTGSSISLTGYSVAMFSNGATTATATFPLYGTLASGDVFIFCADAANATILGKADTALSYPSPAHFNGNDAVILLNSTNDTIDAIGIVGNDPGSGGWAVGSGFTKDYTLVRMATVDAGTNDWTIGATQWDVHPKDTTMFLGSHTSNCTGSTPTGCADIFFSEYIEGGSNNKALEIYNPSTSSINLVGYSVAMFSNGGTTPTATYALSGMLASGEVYVMAADQANAAILAQADTAMSYPSVAHFNGNDAVILLNSSNDTIDAIGIVGVDPGSSGWTVGSGYTKDNTLVRKASVDAGTNDWALGATQWNVHPINTTVFLGAHSSNCIGQPTTPTIAFNMGQQVLPESAGTVPVQMLIGPTSSSTEMVKIYVMEGVGITPGDYTMTPAAVNDTITLSIPAGSDSISFSVNIIDDAILESNDTIFFSIAGVSSGLSVGAISMQDFIIEDNDAVIPTYMVSDVNGLDMDGVADSLGVYCKLSGVVLGVDLQGVGSTAVQFTFNDGQGFSVYSSAMTNYTVTEGDMVRIIGTIDQFNGLSQINADSIVLISSGNPIPSPTVVTVLDESTESELVRINGVTIVDPTQWTNSGSGFNVDITDGTTTWQLRIDNEVDLYSAPAPVGTFDVIGIGGQYDPSSPYSSGYQLLPRYTADIVYPMPPSYKLSISEIMPGSADPNTAVNDDWFEIYNYGQAIVNLNGFSFDDDGETPGDNVFGNVDIQPGEAIVVWRGSDNDEATFRSSWKLPPASVGIQIITRDDLNGNYPSLSQGGDLVVLYDTSAVPVEICKSSYNAAQAGFAVIFDTTCSYQGNAVDGVNGAYTSNGNDVGSPGNFIPIGIHEFESGSINVYPNPASDILNVDTRIIGSYQINVINMLGEVLISEEKNNSNERIAIEALTPGMYMLQIIQDLKMATIPVVIQ